MWPYGTSLTFLIRIFSLFLETADIFFVVVVDREKKITTQNTYYSIPYSLSYYSILQLLEDEC